MISVVQLLFLQKKGFSFNEKDMGREMPRWTTFREDALKGKASKVRIPRKGIIWCTYDSVNRYWASKGKSEWFKKWRRCRSTWWKGWMEAKCPVQGRQYGDNQSAIKAASAVSVLTPFLTREVQPSLALGPALRVIEKSPASTSFLKG